MQGPGSKPQYQCQSTENDRVTLGVLSRKYYYVLGKQEREERRRGEERGKVRGKRKERKKRRERKEERKKGGRWEKKIFWPLSLSLQTHPPAVLTLDRSSIAGGYPGKKGYNLCDTQWGWGLKF